MRNKLKRSILIIFICFFSFYTITLSLYGNYNILMSRFSNQYQEDSPDTFGSSSETINILWNETWGGSAWDEAEGVALDAIGNIYCTGRTVSYGAGSYDLALVKFYPNGTKAWNITWGDTYFNLGYGIDVNIATGNVYCTGYTYNPGTSSNDLILVKFYPNGTEAWNTLWGGFSDDHGWKVEVDTTGNIICVGETESFGKGLYDIAVVKFYPNGTKIWNTTWGSGSSEDRGWGMTLDAAGNIYCTGSTNKSSATLDDFVFIKFDTDGIRLWNFTWGGSSYDFGYDIVVDEATGNIYCTGDTYSSGAGDRDLALVKLYPNGSRIWNTTWGGLIADFGKGVILDSSGNVYCTGWTSNFGKPDDYMLVKFDSNGNMIWNTTWGGFNNENCRGIVMNNATGNVYCIGSTTSFGMGNRDFALVKFDINSPSAPSNPTPLNGATEIITNPILSVEVWDPNNDYMNVSFYNSSDDTLIEMDINISSGGLALITWSGLNWETTYNWYAVVDDGNTTTQSLHWTFTTKSQPTTTTTGIPGFDLIISLFCIFIMISLLIIKQTYKKLL